MSAVGPIRVLVIEDSPVMRTLLVDLIGADPRLEVVGAFETAEQGLDRLEALAPDVVSLDIRLPGMDGFEATRRIMSELPTPIVVVSGSVEREDLAISMRALEAGALTVVEKPESAADAQRGFARRLCDQLALMSRVTVIRQRPPRGSAAPPSFGRHFPAPAGLVALGVVASTGGPRAVSRLLADVGADFPLPVLVVQHITPSFHPGFVDWLAGTSPLPVEAARQGVRPVAGTVYVAPPRHHLRLDGDQLRFDDGPEIDGQRPSGTALLTSLAESCGRRAAGVVLTGMGVDGAQGLLELRLAGAYTVAEDASTAVVHGMPAAAVRLGAAVETLPLGGIGPRLRELVAGRGEAR